ncbi:MAG TPA: ABC transporter permease, partial [Chryseolinea sp.]
MLLSYLKLAVRLLLRNPFFTFINVLGLSVGFAVFIILWQYSRHELKSDRFHKDFDRIYRVVTNVDFTWDGKVWVFMFGYDTPIHTVRLAEKIPQVQSLTRIYNQDNFNATWIEDHSSQLFLTVKSESGDENHFIEKHVAYADPNMFDFFGIELIRGNVLNVLNDANAVAISQQTAQKYFGLEDPLNKILLLNNSIPLKVTGVFADLPKNTHLEFEIVISMRRLEKSINEFKTSAKGGPVSYFKLQQDFPVASLEEVLRDDSRILTNELNKDGNTEIHVSLQPLKEIAFSNLDGDHFLPKSKAYLSVLNAIALVVLVVAWINYVNLTLSLNIKRNKELAMRKTIGAKPSDFIKQFVMESTIINMLSLFIAITLIQLSKGALTILFQFHIYTFDNNMYGTVWIVLLVFALGILVTGFYPALSTLKTTPRALFARVGLPMQMPLNATNTLLIIQYTCSIVLIIGVFAIQRQLDYVLTRGIGINREGIVVLDLPINQPPNFHSSLKTFCDEISDLSFVADFTVSNNVVGDREENGVFIKKTSGNIGFVPDCQGGVDERFLSCYGIPIIAG